MRFLLSLRRVRDAAGQQEDVTLADVDSAEAALGQDRETHVTLPHVEQLLPLLQMEILPLIRSTNKENLQLIVVHHFVANWREEKLLVLFNPFIRVIMNRLLIHRVNFLYTVKSTTDNEHD